MSESMQPAWLDLSAYDLKMGLSVMMGATHGRLGVPVVSEGLRDKLERAGFAVDPDYPRVMWRTVPMDGLMPDTQAAVAAIRAVMPDAIDGAFSLKDNAVVYGARGVFADSAPPMQRLAAQTIRAIHEIDDQDKVEGLLEQMRAIAEAHELDYDTAAAEAGAITGPRM